jgi:transcriptional/translational regulatory protein YebC/TACO1
MPDETDLTDNGLSNIIKVSIKRNHKNMGKDSSVLFYFSTGGKMSATIKVEQEKKRKT